MRRAPLRGSGPDERAGSDASLQGLERGLQVLVYLNQHGRPVRVADVARGTSLPRTTAIRILETLRRLGYVTRHPANRLYRLTINVHRLADGYDDESWIADVARPHAQALTDRYGWPVLLATPLGTSMVWRVNTDRHTGATLQRFHVGMRVPLHRSASGLVFLAFASAAQRRTTLDLLGTSWVARQEELDDRRQLERRLVAIREAGFATYSRPHERESAVSVPVSLGGRYLASLAARYGYRSIRESEVRARFVEPLQQTAARISADFARLAGRAWSGKTA